MDFQSIYFPVDDLKKNIQNFRKLIEKNKDFLSLIVVSKDFMLKLKQYPQEVKIEEKVVINDTTSDEDEREKEVWYLFDIPMVFNSALEQGCIIEDSKGDSLIFEI